jgi:hypothetical protein
MSWAIRMLFKIGEKRWNKAYDGWIADEVRADEMMERN